MNATTSCTIPGRSIFTSPNFMPVDPTAMRVRIVRANVFRLFRVRRDSNAITFLLSVPRPRVDRPSLLTIRRFGRQKVKILHSSFYHSNLNVLSPSNRVLRSNRFRFVVSPMRPQEASKVPNRIIGRQIHGKSPRPNERIMLTQYRSSFHVIAGDLRRFPCVISRSDSPNPRHH